MSDKETVTISKKTPIKMTLGVVAAIIGAVATMVWQTSQIMHKQDTAESTAEQRSEKMHSDCMNMITKMWSIDDMAEWTHQANSLATNHQIPQISEVLRVTRNKN